jgi:hypothetical protein
MTASEVKSHSSIDRFLVVFHSPTGIAKPDCSLADQRKQAERRSACRTPVMPDRPRWLTKGPRFPLAGPFWV